MNNVPSTPSDNSILEMDTIEDAILARWQDPDESQASEDEEDAPLVAEEETDGELELEEVDETDEDDIIEEVADLIDEDEDDVEDVIDF